MAKLTGQQVSDIGASQEFQNRIAAVVKVKAQQFAGMPTTTRADVNRRMQKRKRYAIGILASGADQNVRNLASFWLGWYAYQVDPAVLDAATQTLPALPSYDTIFNSFDATWDQFSGVLVGDDTETEIQW
jgi:hypothetical protein